MSDNMEAGTIVEITLTDFMCHSNLKLTFGPKVNFVVGGNGAGKTALMAAVSIGLGYKMNGHPLKKYIKEGCSTAAIEIHLSNNGVDAFKPNVFGKTIIIKRMITCTSISLELLSFNREMVSTLEKDLIEILLRFNVDWSNTFVFDDFALLRASPEETYTFCIKFFRDCHSRSSLHSLLKTGSLNERMLKKKKKILASCRRCVELCEKKLMEVPQYRQHGANAEEVATKLNTVSSNYRIALDRYEKARKKYEDFKVLLAEMDFLRYRDFCCLRLTKLYQIVLSQHGMSGKVKVDHDKETIDILIVSDATDKQFLRSLRSRGERAFCNFMFILTFLAVHSSTFHIWDDFDVSMDADIRAKTIKTLKSGGCGTQGLYFTSQNIDTSIVDGSNVMLHSL